MPAVVPAVNVEDEPIPACYVYWSMWFFLRLGCPEVDPCEDKSGCDTGGARADTDDTDDTDLADTDTDSPCPDVDETGLAVPYFTAEFTTAGGEYVDARFGLAVYGVRIDDWACIAEGTLPYEGEAPPGCPDCDWAFDLGPITGSTGVGPYCDSLGLTDGWGEGEADYARDFAETYYYDYNGTPIRFANTVFLYTEYWLPFAFEYDARAWVTGDAEHAEVLRPLTGDPESYAYYYYYYYYYPC